MADCYNFITVALSEYAAVVSEITVNSNIKVQMYKTVILTTALYGCETWSLTLRK
jgi:hypothetical protein